MEWAEGDYGRLGMGFHNPLSCIYWMYLLSLGSCWGCCADTAIVVYKPTCLCWRSNSWYTLAAGRLYSLDWNSGMDWLEQARTVWNGAIHYTQEFRSPLYSSRYSNPAIRDILAAPISCSWPDPITTSLQRQCCVSCEVLTKHTLSLWQDMPT